MRILKIVDGFVTNSSSSGNTIILALKKGKKLGEMLEKIGLSSEFTDRFEEEHGLNDSYINDWVEDDYLDSNIYDLQEDYDILQALIITHGFGDEIENVDHSDFRKKFYDEFLVENLPFKLVGNDFIFLHSLNEIFHYRHEEMEDIKNRIWRLIEQIKNPDSEISPRQPKTYVVRELLEPRQKGVIEELEQLIQTRIPVIDSVEVTTIENFLALEEKDRNSLYSKKSNLAPKIEGFKLDGGDVVALGFSFRMNYQKPKIFPISIKYLKKLKILDFGYYKWKEIPKLFGNPKGLEILSIPTDINFKTPPESIGKMISLKRLIISNCKGKILPESLGMLKRLEVLDVRNCNWGLYREEENVPTVIPSTLGFLRALIILNLKNNNIEAVPNSIGNLESLISLNLSGNHIKQLSNSIGNLHSLKELFIYNNKLEKLPNTIGDMISLESILISENPMKKLPTSLLRLNNLKSLWIDNKQMSAFEEDSETINTFEELKKKGIYIRVD